MYVLDGIFGIIKNMNYIMNVHIYIYIYIYIISTYICILIILKVTKIMLNIFITIHFVAS